MLNLAVNEPLRLDYCEPACPLGNRPEDVQAWSETHGRPDDDGQTALQFKHAVTLRRVRGYVASAVSRGATLPLASLIADALDLFDLERGTRMVRYYIAALRSSAQVYVFKRRIGRSFVVFARARHRVKIHRAIANTIGSQGLKQNAGTAGLSRLRRFAWGLGRLLIAKHWDNCKVRPDLRHAFRYAWRSLRIGHRFDDILAAYDSALHRRHQDATDWGLNHGTPTALWEPSSTVTLAAQMLGNSPCNGIGSRVAARAFLGHSDIATTSDFYVGKKPKTTVDFTAHKPNSENVVGFNAGEAEGVK